MLWRRRSGHARSAPHSSEEQELFESYGIVIPPATTPPVVLAALQARVLSQTGETRNKIKTTCQ